jgi:hypothetical protein
MTSDLVAFLRGRLDEDEQTAQAAIKPEEMHPWGDVQLPRQPPEAWPDEVRGHLGGTWGEHCARHDPLRVLAEVQAKRGIIDGLQGDLAAATGLVPAEALGAGLGREFQAMAILRWLALPYASHPDYRAEWSPTGR